ncbi:hypothetical protein F6V25_03950 [Oryzomonas japonica]|uniref:Uncharacterized protein n=1 Tax=Oryzomonas japonica TaxID=2603858 RepID=A0A7J4ZT14_9BACT|nr:hypothetical protein [Oryzomonas japonica]KAB0666578.1 hypothetical protein F6V25_03950 [Oryzomonas japonica]
MKATVLKNALLLSIGYVSNAFAASGAREDNSGLFVWIFLGFCALIVIAQLMPVMLLLFGFAKGLSKDKTAEPQTVKTK